MKYLLFICLVAILFNSCSSSRRFVPGTYSEKRPYYSFIFSEDSTFKYENRGGCYIGSSGIWRLGGNTIYLNSIEQRDKIPIEYKKTNTHTNANKKNAIINVNINAPDDVQQDYICLPNLNGKPILEYTERGSYSFEYEYQIDSIFFVVVKKPFILQGTGTYMCYNEVKTETIYPYLSFGESIDITINIIDSLFRNRAFKNEKIKIKKGKLYFYEKGRYNKLRLKK